MARPRSLGLLPTSTISEVVYGKGIHVPSFAVNGGIPLMVISPGEDTAHLGVLCEFNPAVVKDLGAISSQAKSVYGSRFVLTRLCGEQYQILPSDTKAREQAKVFPPPKTEFSIATPDRSIEFHFSGHAKPQVGVDFPNLTIYISAKALVRQPDFRVLINEIEHRVTPWFTGIQKVTLQRMDVAIDIIGVPVTCFVEFFMLKAVTSRLAEKHIFAEGIIEGKDNWNWQGATVLGEEEHLTIYDKIAKLTNPLAIRQKEADLLAQMKWPGVPDCPVSRIEIRLRDTVKAMQVTSRAGLDHPRAWVDQRTAIIKKVFNPRVVFRLPPVNRKSASKAKVHPVWEFISREVCSLASHPDWHRAVHRRQSMKTLKTLNNGVAFRQNPLPVTPPPPTPHDDAVMWGMLCRMASRQGISAFNPKAMERLAADLIRRQIQGQNLIPPDLAKVVGIGTPRTFSATSRRSTLTIKD
jgi:hypothetical protein